MTAVTSEAGATPVHPLWLRITHWLNALAVIVLMGSGWEIYNASPLFMFTFPRSVTLGGWLGGALLWHFAAMWLIAVNGLVYVGLALASGRFRTKLLPLRVDDVLADAGRAVRGRLTHAQPARYNALQKLSYIGIIIVGVIIVLSGLAMWKPVQLWWLAALFGGYEAARLVHFFAMAAIVGFLIVHIVMAFVVPRSLRAMIIGR